MTRATSSSPWVLTRQSPARRREDCKLLAIATALAWACSDPGPEPTAPVTRLALAIGLTPEDAQAKLGGALHQDVFLGWSWSPESPRALVAAPEAGNSSTVEAALWSAPGGCEPLAAQAVAAWGAPVEETCRARTYWSAAHGVEVALVEHGAECVVHATRPVAATAKPSPAPRSAPCPSGIVSEWLSRAGPGLLDADSRARHVAQAAAPPVTSLPEDWLETTRHNIRATWLGPSTSCPAVIEALSREIGEPPRPVATRSTTDPVRGWAGDTAVISVAITDGWCRVETHAALYWW